MNSMNGSVVRTADGKEMWRDASGAYIPVENIREIDVLRDEMVRQLIMKVDAEAGRLMELKQTVLRTLEDFMELSASQYGVAYRGASGKGNVQFKSYDGSLKIEIKMADSIEFDEQLVAAKALIDNCLIRWSEGANANLAILVKDAFKVDRKGQLDTRRILQLRSYKIEDSEWQEAMVAIGNAIKVRGSKRYVRFYSVDKEGGQHPIPIDWTSI